MIESWKKVAEPAVEPVGTARLKQHLRLSDDEEDVQLAAYLLAARMRVEEECRRSLVNTTWMLCRSSWGCDGLIRLPRGRLQSVSLVTYLGYDNLRRTWDDAEYQVATSSEPGLLLPAYGEDWPEALVRPESVQITYVAGYGATAESVPAPLAAAILLIAAGLYENREEHVTGTIVSVNPAAAALIAQYRQEEWRP